MSILILLGGDIMKNTGIVRRIDDLGRVVIPKEIRKTLRIFDGDSIEIYTGQNNEIILKKHSQLSNIWSFADDYAYCLSKFINNPILIFNLDKLIIAHGKNKDKLIDLIPSKSFDQIFLKQTNFSTALKENNLIFNSKNFEFLVPIVVDGSTLGGICCISDEKLQKSDENLILLASIFIGKHLDN